MTTQEKSIEYLEKLLARLEIIESLDSPLKKMQAKLDLKDLFEDCYKEGRDSREDCCKGTISGSDLFKLISQPEPHLR